MSKYKFENNTWITFVLNNNQCVGRTVIIQGQEMVGIVDENGNVGHLPFIEIEKPIKLNMVKNPSKENLNEKLQINDEYIKMICFVKGET